MVINAGSSSLKFCLYEMPKEEKIFFGLIERVGSNNANYSINFNKINKKNDKLTILDHTDAVKLLLNLLIENKVIKKFDEIDIIGHRVVQGGKYFANSVEFNDDTSKKIESLITFAPLHNPAHLACFKAFKKIIPKVLSIATFDTSFYYNMQDEDCIFPIPYEFTKKYNIKRYGAHGINHQYLALKSKKYLKNIKNPKIITCHLGNGSSITATKNYKCVATSMGLTPLGGIMMGTRTGDLDPSVFYHLIKCTNKSVDEIYQILNKKSGFLGVSGISNDARDVLKAEKNNNKQAILTNKLFIRRILDYIGQYYVRLGGCDLIVFSAGIGENNAHYREKICEGLFESLKVIIDKKKNNSESKNKEKIISTNNSKIKVVVIPANEELMIAHEAYNFYLKKNKK